TGAALLDGRPRWIREMTPRALLLRLESPQNQRTARRVYPPSRQFPGAFLRSWIASPVLPIPDSGAQYTSRRVGRNFGRFPRANASWPLPATSRAGMDVPRSMRQSNPQRTRFERLWVLPRRKVHPGTRCRPTFRDGIEQSAPPDKEIALGPESPRRRPGEFSFFQILPA